ncbi:hypothetical protein LguiA_015148 [Lonicera macranthoides]
MIQLLYPMILGEMGLIVILVFKTPLRKVVIMGLDRVKRGRGPIVVKAIAGTVFVVMMSSLYNAIKIRRLWIQEGDVNPTDQVLMARHLLEASLMGFALFLALMIDRLHHYIRELRLRRKNIEAVKKQNRAFEDGRSELKALEEETTTLRAKINILELEVEAKKNEAGTAEANADSLKKRSEGFLLEYDRLLEDNQNLHSQLEALSYSPGSKK